MKLINHREQLNNRFITAFNHLKVAGVIGKNSRGENYSSTADKIGTKVHILRKYLDGERHIPYEKVQDFANRYGINKTFLFEGLYPVFNRSEELDGKAKIVSKSTPKLNVVYSSIPVGAGEEMIEGLFENVNHFNIPGQSGNLAVLDVKGNSMHPTIEDGDQVICEFVESYNDIRENEICVITTNSRAWIKRVKFVRDGNAKIQRLLLISDNAYEGANQPIDLDPQEILHLLRVKNRIVKLAC